MRGERSDGHDYLLDAIQRGATGLLIEETYLNALSQDTLTTLAQSNTNYRCSMILAWHCVNMRRLSYKNGTPPSLQ